MAWFIKINCTFLTDRQSEMSFLAEWLRLKDSNGTFLCGNECFGMDPKGRNRHKITVS